MCLLVGDVVGRDYVPVHDLLEVTLCVLGCVAEPRLEHAEQLLVVAFGEVEICLGEGRSPRLHPLLQVVPAALVLLWCCGHCSPPSRRCWDEPTCEAIADADAIAHFRIR